MMMRLRVGHRNLNSTLYYREASYWFLGVLSGIRNHRTCTLSCTRYEEQRRNIMKELRRIVLSGTGIKDMLQIGVNGKGRINICNFLIKTDLMG